MNIPVGKLVSLLLPLTIVAVLATLIELDRREELQRYAAEQAAAQALEDAERRIDAQVFRSGTLDDRIEHCYQRMLDQLPYWRPLYAIAIHGDRIDALFYWGRLQDGFKRYSCDQNGLAEERVAAPLPVPVEHAGDAAPDIFGAARQAMNGAELTEVLVAPDGIGIVVRRTRTAASALESEVSPPDTPEFSWISTAPMVQAAVSEGANASARPMLASWPARQWLRETDAAFALIDSTLDHDLKRRITGIRFNDDGIELEIKGPFEALSAPYGDISIDRFGAVTSWLYPRDGQFSCSQGASLSELRRAFDESCRLAGCGPHPHLSIASYGCWGKTSPGWTIHRQH